jgi:hypothetical protein
VQSLIVGYASIFAPALIGLLACAVAGYLMLARIKRGFAGFLLGLLLGPIGLVIAWVIRDNKLRDLDEARARERAMDLPDLGAGVVPRRTFSQELDDLVAQRARGEITHDEYQRRKEQLFGQ